MLSVERALFLVTVQEPCNAMSAARPRRAANDPAGLACLLGRRDRPVAERCEGRTSPCLAERMSFEKCCQVHASFRLAIPSASNLPSARWTDVTVG